MLAPKKRIIIEIVIKNAILYSLYPTESIVRDRLKGSSLCEGSVSINFRCIDTGKLNAATDAGANSANDETGGIASGGALPKTRGRVL